MNQNILKQFIDWSKLKFKVHSSEEISFYFHEREIWWASIGQNVGSEENGKNKNFERPVLVLRKFNKDMFLGVPMSSIIKIGKYHHIVTIDGKDYCFILSQIRLFSSKRLLRQISKWRLSSYDTNQIREKIGKIL